MSQHSETQDILLSLTKTNRMKKLYPFISLVFFVSFLTACSDENSLENLEDTNAFLDSVVSERTISTIESERFDTSSGQLTQSGISYLENGKIVEVLNYQDDVLDSRIVYEYNDRGLVKRVSNFDGNNSPLPSRDFSIVYDTQARVRNIVYMNHIVEFTYNEVDKTVTRRSFDSSNPNLATATYFLNDENKIVRFESSLSDSSYEFEYIGGKLTGATSSGGYGNIEVNYDYTSSQETKGFNYPKFYRAMYGAPNNSVFTSQRSIENMISLFYGEENPSLIAYYIDQPLQTLETRFEYTLDTENYVTQFEMIANGNLYARIKITYED